MMTQLVWEMQRLGCWRCWWVSGALGELPQLEKIRLPLLGSVLQSQWLGSGPGPEAGTSPVPQWKAEQQLLKVGASGEREGQVGGMYWMLVTHG